jgi:hypothetical protein
MASDKKRRIPRPTQERIAACESHLFFLHEDLKLFPQQYDRYKQIAGKLRVLVCKTRSNKPLLLDLMDELGFNYNVPPPGPPGPITMPIALVGWRTDPDFQAHVRELEEAGGDQQKRAAIHEKHNAKFRKSMPLREYTDKAFATLIYFHEYSFCELVLDVAQQCGSSHEDEAIDEPIAQMRTIRIGGVEQHVAVIVDYAKRVLDAGANFILYAVEKGLYEARYFAKKTV